MMNTEGYNLIEQQIHMGGEDSKPTQDDFFLLEHLSKMSLKNRKIISYYLISSQNGPALPPLRQYFKIDTFPSVTTLKQQMSFVHKQQIVKVIVTDSVPQTDINYLQQEPKVSQIISYNLKLDGPKVKGHATNTEDLIQTLNDLEERESLEVPPSNVLFTIDQDTKTLNRYRLNYHCNTIYGDRKAAKEDFVRLAKKLYPDQQAAIAEFEEKYNLNLKGEQKNKMVLDWAFKNNFYWDMVHNISRNTSDPKRLAYLRLGIKDIYEAVAAEYRANKLYDIFYVALELTEEERGKLEKSVNNFLLFTSFVKGTFVEKEGMKQFKGKPNNVLFTIVPHRSERGDTLDFGFVRRGDEVLVNIYNVFRVDMEANPKTRRIELVYGVLPVMDQRRQVKEERGGMTKIQLDLTRNYDFIEDLMSKVDGQATLLQLSGYYKDSLDIYDKKVDFIRKTNQSQETMNRCMIRKGDALALSGDYAAAEKTYRSVESSSKTIKAIALIHLADMYMRIGDEVKLESVINQLDPLLPALQSQPKERDEYFKGKHFQAIKSLKKGSHKKAEEMLGKLLTEISKVYSHNLEGKPLYHDVYRTLAACQFKLGRAPDALNTLNTTRELQLACEGKTHNLAMTETLIQSVSRTCGNKEQLSKSQARMQDLSQQIDSNQTRLSPSSVTNLNSSMIAISM